MFKDILERLFFGDVLEHCQSGTIFAVDGDTLKIGSEKFRLYGMDAPEHDQKTFLKNKKAGDLSFSYLSSLIKDKPVFISRVGKDIYGRSLARVKTPDISDVSLKMIADGYAISLLKKGDRFFKDYSSAAKTAYVKKSGLWAFGGFEDPRRFRDRMEVGKEVRMKAGLKDREWDY